ncbi:MAG: phosphoribosylaminoimidazolecarboxamide formyltransferase [Pseudomonadales bacterium]|nr:phosphoribosylaminoimidazolecarboxamide formyltransferase [Pseudomonadales bacterium]
MSRIPLKYGVNPHQGNAVVTHPDNPLEVLSGQPGYIKLLDALTAWQLVLEMKRSTGKASAASFKHVSPAGAAIAKPLTDGFLASQFLQKRDYSPVATAYARARGGDRMCSFGDAVAVSETVDVSLANLLKPEVSDLIIAPDYEPEALKILAAKKGGKYLVLRMDPDYVPPAIERRELFGFTFEQDRNNAVIDAALFDGAPQEAIETLIVATLALKYAQSNSVCVAFDGQVIGLGAGQQSRIHCTRLACDKAEKWMLQFHPTVLGLQFNEGLKKPDKANVVDQYLLWDSLSEAERNELAAGVRSLPAPLSPSARAQWIAGYRGLCLSSDAYIPFRDNIDRAAKTGIEVIAHPGGSVRDEIVHNACREHDIQLVETGVRCFLH